MLHILLVKYEQYSDIRTQENNEGLAHRASILKYLTLPWDNYKLGFCADFYFASVSIAEEITWLVSLFIGVVKTTTKKLLMNYPSEKELTVGRWQQIGVVIRTTEVPTIIAYVWLDNEKRYFIST